MSEQERELRAIVLSNYECWSARSEYGPCGAIVVALSRLAFGKVVRICAKTTKDRSDCAPSFDKGFFAFPHYVVLTPLGDILDVALPPDFELAGYENYEECANNLPEEHDDYWNEADYIFWYERLNLTRGGFQKMTDELEKTQELLERELTSTTDATQRFEILKLMAQLDVRETIHSLLDKLEDELQDPATASSDRVKLLGMMTELQIRLL